MLHIPLLPTPQTGAEKATNVAHPLLPTPQTGTEKATNVANPLLTTPKQTGSTTTTNITIWSRESY